MTRTIYMDMPLKPNILNDITKDQFIISPPPRDKYVDMGLDQTMLEDESGRLRLTGGALRASAAAAPTRLPGRIRRAA